MKFDRDGLVPVIAQDAASGVVRMFAWANADALRATIAGGGATFWSRSRQALWRKGAESGHVLAVRDVRLDCDGDVVLYSCDPQGPSCHTGADLVLLPPGAPGGPRPRRVAARAAGGRRPARGIGRDPGPPGAGGARRAGKSRRTSPTWQSLLQKGFPKINAKITEEAREITEAFIEGDRTHITHEAADVLFHVMVGLEAAEVPIEAVFAELRRRFGVGGHVEKASRPGVKPDPG